MPFIKRQDVDVKIRKPYDEAHRKQLRQALLNPALTAEQRKHLQSQIASVGQQKEYDPNSPPKLGAVVLNPGPDFRKKLEAMKKPDLVKMARERGLPVSGTKAQLIDRLLGQ